MEACQQLTAVKDQEKLQPPDNKRKENEENGIDKKIGECSTEPVSEPSNEKVVEEKMRESTPTFIETSNETGEIFQKDPADKSLVNEDSIKDADAVASTDGDNKDILEKNAYEVEKKSKESSREKSHLPSFPGTVTKPVPGSNDVKIEIDSNSLLDRVILYSLKNTVVDNSRLDAAKSKYMMNNGNSSSNFNSNSNESDSNSSSKSGEKLIEEFKEGCSKTKIENSSCDTSPLEKKSDISNESLNDAEKCVDATSNRDSLEKDSKGSVVREKFQIVITTQAERETTTQEPLTNDRSGRSDDNKPRLHSFPLQQNLENEALDFREKASEVHESPLTMLDLSIPHRNEKSVPPIKRNHALYVGLPDFSKQIFSAPSFNSAINTITNQHPRLSSSEDPPKTKKLDFSDIARGPTDMQMRHPDFSKSFSKELSLSSIGSVPVTPSNFPEIVRKNNYICDLQLKPTMNANSHSTASTSLPSSYKIDYHSSPVTSQHIIKESKPEQALVSGSQIAYPNMKKEGINAYNQQLYIEEPMAHIIHKNQFFPHPSKTQQVGGGWADGNERLYGSSSSTSKDRFKPHSKLADNDNKSEIPLDTYNFHHASSEELRKNHQAHYPPPLPSSQSNQERDFENKAQEYQQMSLEFSLKQKEKQLRQEGTIITVKNEPVRTPIEKNERCSADLFRDYKLKQPKESPESLRRSAEILSGYQQAYPDFPASYRKFDHHQKMETIIKPSRNSPAIQKSWYHQDIQANQPSTNSRSFYNSSPVSYSHHQPPKSPITNSPGSMSMNPPQQWPLLTRQLPTTKHIQRQAMSSISNPPTMNSQHHSSPSNSPHLNYGFTAAAESGSVTINQKYQSTQYSTRRNFDTNRHYHPPSSTSQTYYHQKYPDFARHFDPETKQPTRDPISIQPTSFVPIEHLQIASEMNYQRFPPNHDLEIRTARDQPQHRSDSSRSHYPNSHHDSEVGVIQEYTSRVQEPIVCHPEVQLRMHDASYERSLQPLKYESRIDESHKIHAVSSNLSLKPPEPTEVSLTAKVKTEPAQGLARNETPVSRIPKFAKSLLAEVKRESPLDLSVKTVKTKADSTGCDQDISTRQYVESSGLKVEFTPNFGKVTKTDCRRQALMGPQYPISSQNVVERSAELQKHIEDFETARVPAAPTMPNLQQPQTQASSSRSFYHEHRFQPVRGIARTHAPAPLIIHNPQTSERYTTEGKQLYTDAQTTGSLNMAPAYSPKDVPKSDEKLRFDLRRATSYYPQPQRAQPSSSGFSHATKSNHHTVPIADVTRPPKQIPPHASNMRNQLYFERERDRKYVEEILNRQNRKDPLPTQPDISHFHPIISPPRKRASEQPKIASNAMPPKHSRFEEPTRLVQDTDAMMHKKMSQQFPEYEHQNRFESIEGEVNIIGQPPALVKSEGYQQSSSVHTPDSEVCADNRREITMNTEMSAKSYLLFPNSNHYPNPKAEMIHRSDPTTHGYKQEKLQFLNQNFEQRPDDNTLQYIPRIHHPIQTESAVKNEHQPTGPIPGTSGESSKLSNGITLLSLSGSNSNIARRADQSTILKLKTNLELREQKRLIISSSRSEPGDEVDNQQQQQLQKKELSPRQFRTKGELKGFIPLPMRVSSNKIITLPTFPSVLSAQSAFDLLDWGCACNDFVQQLETGKKKTKKKLYVAAGKVSDVKQDEKAAIQIPGRTANNLSEVPEEVLKSINRNDKSSSSEEDKPLLDLVNIQSDTKRSHDTVVEKISKKISRNIREKQRLDLEQKLAVRLGRPSSSESETDARRAMRTTKRVRRLRKRAALGIKKTDEELSVEEEETEEDLTMKRLSSNSISKVDDLTSSDEDKKKMHSSDKKSSTDRKFDKKSSKTPKEDFKKQHTSTESSESEEPTSNKISKISSAKNVKKLKDLGDGSSIKNLLKEEETMTRSKRKLEIERKLSNSKILRNEKIVQNVVRGRRFKADVLPTLTIKKTSPKRKVSSKAEDSKRKVESESDTNAKRNQKRLRHTSKMGSSSSCDEESQAGEDNKSEK